MAQKFNFLMKKQQDMQASVKKRGYGFLSRLYRSDPSEYFGIKFVFGTIFGVLVGHGYYQFTFSGVFQEHEEHIKRTLYWSVVALTGLSCGISVQCRCVAMLCLPTMLGRTGRSVLQALVATWILAGPISNIMHHSGEVIHSMTCIARMQSRQMAQLMNILHAPVTAGLAQLVNDAEALNDTEKMLLSNMEEMKEELWSNELRQDSDSFESQGDIASKLRTDATRRCTGLFEYGVAECVRLFRQKEQECRDTIGIPILRDILCFVMKASFLCDVVGYFDAMCRGVPHVDSESVNRNYSDLGRVKEQIGDEFKVNMKWKIPHRDETTGVVTVDEIVERLETEYGQKKRIFDFSTSLIKKFVAVSFVFVLSAASSYNRKYLTDIRFDNLYVTSYFRRKDYERKMQGKRSLLPLTRLEKKNVIFPHALKLTQAEKKSVVFKVLKVLGNILFTVLLLLFDHVIYTVLHLVRKHGKVETSVRARHMLEVHIEGNKTVATLLQRLFLPFKDNDHILESETNNLACLPDARKLPSSDTIWIMALYVILLLTVLLDAYALRLRHVIASIAYRRREKSRVVMLYGDIMRRRKNALMHVRLTVRKLARNFRLKQKHSFMEALRFKLPFLRPCFRLLGVGVVRCVICEDKETKKRPLIICDEEKCRIRYCTVCWEEVGSCCWACKHYKPTAEELKQAETSEDNESEASTDKDFAP